MLAANSSCGRRSHFAGTPTTATSIAIPGRYLIRPRLPLRNYLKSKGNFLNYAEPAEFARMKRLKAKKVNGAQKLDSNKKKSMDYTEMAYREAVSKLKYLLAESYVPRATTEKSQGFRNIYQTRNARINESGEDTDDRSIISDSSRTKDLGGNAHTFANSYFPSSKNIYPAKAYSNLALSATDLQSAPPELSSFIERQEEYIEQLERESQFCRDELTNLLRKVREVVAENEALHNRNKTGFLKCALEEHKHFNGGNNECNKSSTAPTEIAEIKKHKPLEGPSIVFESRISELEAQLTQARLELRKAQEENQANLKRLSESCSNNDDSEIKIQMEHALRAKFAAEIKLEDLQKSLSVIRDKESEALQKAKRSMDAAQQAEFEKNQCEIEVRRLKEELERQHEKLREATQEANRRIAEERQQAERRYSQQVEQMSADIACHWDTASKSQLESEKQRRDIADLKRELSQKQTCIDTLKKELQNKISNLQSELNQAITEKDAADQEILATKSAVERTERQCRQEQNRLHAEINSYKQRLERADADLVHCRRENLRLLEQTASLEKEISMNKAVQLETSRAQAPSKMENEKELTSMIMDMETKHEGVTERDVTTVGKTASTSNKKRTVKVDLKVKVIPKQKEEMASLQSNIEYLSDKIQGTFNNQKDVARMQEHISATVPQLVHQEYNAIVNKEHKINEESSEEHISPEQGEIETTNTFQSNRNEVTAEFLDQQENQNNAQKYVSDDQNLESYVTEDQYNQYEQYNPTGYEQQEYMDGNQYSSKEVYNESQYSADMHENNSK